MLGTGFLRSGTRHRVPSTWGRVALVTVMSVATALSAGSSYARDAGSPVVAAVANIPVDQVVLAFSRRVFGGDDSIVLSDAKGGERSIFNWEGGILLGTDVASPWSPEGQTLAFSATAGMTTGGDDLYRVHTLDVATGDHGVVTRKGTSAPAWSPNGLEIAVYSRKIGGIAAVELEGLTQRTIVAGRYLRHSEREPIFNDEAAWSPDGKWIVFGRGKSSMFGTGNTNWHLRRIRSDGTGGKALTGNRHDHFNPVISPAGDQILFTRTAGLHYRRPKYELMTMRVDGDRLRRRAAGIHLTEGLWSPDGTKIAYTACPRRCGIYVLEPGGTERLLTSGWDPQWSPDGARLAFTRVPRGEEDTEIFVVDVTTGDVDRVTSNADTVNDDQAFFRPLP